MEAVFNRLVEELERPRTLTAQTLRHLEATYGITREETGSFLDERLPGLDETELDSIVRVAVRFLDDVVDVSNYPLPAQEKEAKAKRRIGLGVTGLADALIMCRARYGQPDSVNLIERWFKVLRRAAYLASADIAAEKGPFPLFDREKFLSGKTVAALEPEVRQAIAEKGIRNALLTSIAPTGTISLLADNVSSGIEPVFAYRYTRKVTQADGSRRDEEVEDYAHKLYRELNGDAPLPAYFVNAQELTPEAHLAVQAAAQNWILEAVMVGIPQTQIVRDTKDRSRYYLCWSDGTSRYGIKFSRRNFDSALTNLAPGGRAALATVVKLDPGGWTAADEKLCWPQ